MQTSRLTRTLRRLIRRDPAARLVDTTAGQQLRGDAHGDREREQRSVDDRLVENDVDDEYRRRQRTRDVDKQHGELAQPDLELGVELMGAETGSNLSELGARASRHDNPARATRMYDGAHQRAPGQLGQRRAGGNRIGCLLDRHRLARQYRLVALEVGRFDQSDVGRHDAAEP